MIINYFKHNPGAERLDETRSNCCRRKVSSSCDWLLSRDNPHTSQTLNQGCKWRNTQNAIFLDTNASENKIVIARKRQSRRFIVSAVLMADKTLNKRA